MNRLLFVCMGNICRSPSAECMMRDVLEKRGLSAEFSCDSAGTIGFHTGKPPDARMRRAGRARGLAIEGAARQVEAEDLERFDLILAMDHENFRDLHELARSEGKGAKIHLMCDFLTRHKTDEVPDPYYGGSAGFDLVLDLLEDACNGLADHLQSR